MEGNMLYNQYLKPNSDYYGKPDLTREVIAYDVSELPSTYTTGLQEGSFWKYYRVHDRQLPDQGWKIHMTSIYADAQRMLEQVANICFKHSVEFKHIKDNYHFMIANSKNANRSSSGKFITIYPYNNELFIELLEELSISTKMFKRGPYILSDKRWKDSNVFYRYGGFKRILNQHGMYCIKDPMGNLVEDTRNPFYQVPDFVRSFDEHLTNLNILDHPQAQKQGNLERYEIKAALSYSNAGGVYVALRKEDNLKVIIKEARPYAGLDSQNQDAFYRQQKEHDALKTLETVAGVVNVIEYFQEWEHYFLVEEFIEGRDLRQWLAQEFPFFGDSQAMKNHAQKVKSILLEVFNLIDKMHSHGLAMGDLQPANIMLTADMRVRMIDFETVISVHSTEKPSMATIGFVSPEIKVGGARDWFGLKRLARYLALPVLCSEDLNGYLQSNHFHWIKANYESFFYNFMIELLDICDQKIQQYQEYRPEPIDLKTQYKTLSLNTMLAKLSRGLELHLTDDERLINGDIRQFEMSGGKSNFLTGGSGAAYALAKMNSNILKVDTWIQQFVLHSLPDVQDQGLLTGRLGIMTLLYEKGYQKIVHNEINALKENIDEVNISLRNGLSGLGLFVISLYVETEYAPYLEFAKQVEYRMKANRDHEHSLKVKDWMGVNIGIVDGLAGVSLFYSALYSVTNDDYYLEQARLLIQEDLQQTQKDEITEVLQTTDKRNRLLPYLSGGTIGIAISIWYLNHVSAEDFYKEEINAIMKLSKTRSTISGSLFDGAGGFLLLASMLDEGEERNTIMNEVLQLLSLFVIEKDDYAIYPGQFSYRLSDDVYTGSAGIILAMLGVTQNNPLYWIPLINVDGFVEKTKGIKLNTASTN